MITSLSKVHNFFGISVNGNGSCHSTGCSVLWTSTLMWSLAGVVFLLDKMISEVHRIHSYRIESESSNVNHILTLLWTRPNVHSMLELEWIRILYIWRRCGRADKLSTEARPSRNGCHPIIRDSVMVDLYPVMENSDVTLILQKLLNCFNSPGYPDDCTGKSRTRSDVWCQRRRSFQLEYCPICRSAPFCQRRKVACDVASGRRWMWCRDDSQLQVWCKPLE